MVVKNADESNGIVNIVKNHQRNKQLTKMFEDVLHQTYLVGGVNPSEKN